MPNVWFPSQALTEMEMLADKSYPLETGGMLLGYVADNNDVVVTAIIGPGPAAKHARHAFEPDSVYQIEILHSHYCATDGRETYLGDWHSHPDGVSILSRTDKRTLASIAHDPSSGIKRPVMAIIASSAGQWSVGVVRFDSMQRRLFVASYTLEELIPKIY